MKSTIGGAAALIISTRLVTASVEPVAAQMAANAAAIVPPNTGLKSKISNRVLVLSYSQMMKLAYAKFEWRSPLLDRVAHEDFTMGNGMIGFFPRSVGKVFLVDYLGSDFSCAIDQTEHINAAIFDAGNGGDIEMPQACIRYTSGLVTLPGQHWYGAGDGIETSDTYFSPPGQSQSNGSANNNSAAGTHLRYDQVSGSAVTLVGDGAKLDHLWLTNSQAGASFTGSISISSNGVSTLNVSATGVTGTIKAGQILSGAGVAPDMMIATGANGTGGAGSYRLMSVAGPISVVAQAAVSSEGMTTASSAIAVQLGEKREPDGTQAVNPSSQTLDTIRVEGFGTNIDVQSGSFWTISNFALHGAGLYGVRARNFNYPDSGDGALINGNIYGHGIDGVRYEFGGGLKLISVKILGGPHAFELAVPDSLTYTVRGSGAATTVPINTSDIFVPPTNSFENQTASAVVLGCNGPKNSGIFNGLFFDMQLAAPAPPANQAAAGFVANGCVQGVDIAGSYGGFGSGAIVLNGGGFYMVHPRAMGGLTGPALSIANGVVGVSVPYLPPVSFNKSQGSGYYTIIDKRMTDDGILDRTDVRYVIVQQSKISAGSSTPSSTPLYSISVPPFRGARVTLEAEGVVQGAGQVNILQDILVNNTGGGIAPPTVVTSAGATSQLSFVYSFSGQTLTIALQVHGGDNAGDFQGSVTFRAQGKTLSYEKL